MSELCAICASDGGDDDTGPETVDIYGAGGSKVFLHQARRPLMETQLSSTRTGSQPTTATPGSRTTARTSMDAMSAVGAMDVI